MKRIFNDRSIKSFPYMSSLLYIARMKYLQGTRDASNLDKDELLKPEIGIKRLQVSPSKFYSMLADGSLPYVTIGRAKRVLRSDLERFIKEHTHGKHATTGSDPSREPKK